MIRKLVRPRPRTSGQRYSPFGQRLEARRRAGSRSLACPCLALPLSPYAGSVRQVEVRADGAIGRTGLGVAFVVVHVLLWWGNTVPINNTSSSDTHVYLAWVEAWRTTGRLVGVDLPWVYPIGALPPMLLAFVLGPALYLTAWVAMVAVLDAVAMVLLARRSMRAAWWWLACIALLGPAGLSHLDGVALPFAVVGVLAIRRHPAAASALFTLAAWIKVWPAAMVAALLTAGRRRLPVLLAAAVTTAAVIGLAVAAGARRVLFSFVDAQAARGLQIESPAASPWLLWGAFGGRARIVYDGRIMTFEVQARHVQTAAAVMTPVLAAGVTVVVVLALIALRRGRDRAEVLACTALGLVSALIALNKVGSPQYYDWLVAPVLLGLLSTRIFRLPAVLVVVTSALTFVIYPIGYDAILQLQPAMIGVLALRNLLTVALFVWSLIRLASTVRSSAPSRRPSSREDEAGVSGNARRGVLVVIAPLLLGLILALIGMTHPGGPVRGDLRHGPIGVPLPRPPGFRSAYQVHWGSGHDRIALVVRQARACPPAIRDVTSTAPARLEVEIRASLSRRCLTHPVLWSFQLPKPKVVEPGQGVEVFVNGYRLALAAYHR